MNNGGPAFPTGKWETDHITNDQEYERYCPMGGMSLRDYFAGKSLMELVQGLSVPVSDVDAEAVAKDAYKLADAMIKEKEKGEQNHA